LSQATHATSYLPSPASQEPSMDLLKGVDHRQKNLKEGEIEQGK